MSEQRFRAGDRVEWVEVVLVRRLVRLVRLTGTVVRSYCDVAVDGDSRGIARRTDIDTAMLSPLGPLDALAEVLDEE